MATLKDTLVLGKLTVVDKIVKSGGLPTSILTGDGSMASVGSRTDSTATTGNSGQIYLVQRNAAGQLVVDVPWSAGSGDVVATSVTAGGGIDVTAGTSSYTVSHKDTSTATSVDGAIVNKITIDGYGHVTALGTTTIDLGSYVTGSGLTANTVILGNGSGAIKTSSKTISTSVGADDTTIPTSKAVQTYVTGFGYTTNTGTVTGSGLTDNQIIIGTGGVGIEASGKTISTSVGADDTTVPTSKAIKTWVEGKGYLTTVSWDDLTNKPTIPTIPTNNVTGSGTNGMVAKFTGTNTIGNGYAVGTSSDYAQTPAANRDSTLLTQAAIQTYVTGLGYTSNTGNVTGSGLTANTILLGNGSSAIKTSSKTISTSVGNDDTTVPTSKAVRTWTTGRYLPLTGGYLTGTLYMSDYNVIQFGQSEDDEDDIGVTMGYENNYTVALRPASDDWSIKFNLGFPYIELNESDYKMRVSYNQIVMTTTDENLGVRFVYDGITHGTDTNPSQYKLSYPSKTGTLVVQEDFSFDATTGTLTINF